MAADRMAVRVIVAVLFVGVIIQGYEYNEYVVPCDHSMASCVCPVSVNSVKVDVCIFSLFVDNYQTFTRYRIDPVSNSIAVPHGGRVWYINDTTGDYQPFPDHRTVCDKTSSHCTQPFAVDGYSFRTYYSVNGRIPGPSLIVNYNQTIVVNVTNILDSESVSIHWHGINQHNTNWMDGVQHITQCGINSGTSFTYIFQADPPGTHWYHSHSGSQRNEGVYGSLIVMDDISVENSIRKKIGIDYQDSPETHTLLFQDWQNNDAADILLLSTSNTHFYGTNDAPDPSHYTILRNTLTVDGTIIGPIQFWSGLINGRGRNSNVSYIKTRLSIFTVSPETAYRFRLIGAQHVFAFMISFDEHRFQVIIKDGVYVKPLTVDYLIIQPGERYDILLVTKPLSAISKKNNFIIRAETIETLSDNNNNNDDDDDDDVLKLSKQNMAEAILHYDTNGTPLSNEYSSIAANSIPVNVTCTRDTPCITLNCPFKSFPDYYNITCIHINQLQLLNELTPDQLPDIIPDQTLFFNFGFEGMRGSSSVNARNNRLPSSPLTLLRNTTQLQQLSREEFCQGIHDYSVCDTNNNILSSECVCTNVWNISTNNTIMLVLSAISNNEDTPTSSHSVHLHGHHFHIVDMQFGNYSNNGRLISNNNDIDCGGESHCTLPHWRSPGHHGYPPLGKKGKINSSAPLSDTITIPAGGYVVVYYQSNNPGYWYLHSQTELHHLPGMGVVLKEGQIDEMTVPPEDMNLCGNFLWTVEEYYNHFNTATNRIASSPASSSCYKSLLVPMVLIIIIVILVIMIVITIVFITYKRYCTTDTINVITSYKEMVNDINDNSSNTDVELDQL